MNLKKNGTEKDLRGWDLRSALGYDNMEILHSVKWLKKETKGLYFICLSGVLLRLWVLGFCNFRILLFLVTQCSSESSLLRGSHCLLLPSGCHVGRMQFVWCKMGCLDLFQNFLPKTFCIILEGVMGHGPFKFEKNSCDASMCFQRQCMWHYE